MTRRRLIHRLRKGMTLLEVMVSMAIICGVFIGLSTFTFRLARATAASRLIAEALQLVGDRIETVKSGQRYVALDSQYVATESPVAGYPEFIRQTMIKHVGGLATDSTDYRIVTVEVRSTRLTAAVRKTIYIAPF